MSGLEASAAVFGFIAGAIDITHKAVEIYRAVEDKSGIPKALRKVSEKLPSVEGILRNAEAQCKGLKFDTLDEWTLRDMKRDVQDCRESCKELHELLLNAYPKEGSGKAGRLWKGTKTVFSSKGKTAEGLLEEIRMYLELLASRQVISNAVLLKDIKSLVEELPREGGSMQQQSALLSSGHKAHGSVKARNSDILQSWTLSSQGRTSSLVSLSTKLQPAIAARSWQEGHPGRVLTIRIATESSGRTRFERIYRRISDYDPKIIYRRLSARKAANTNKWLVDHDDFQTWLRHGANLQSHLWLSGKVGSGKSTLVTTVIDECIAQRKPGDCSVVLMFFFQGQEDTVLSLFESLTKQLIAALMNAGATCSPEVLSNLEEAYGREVSRPDIAQVVHDLVIPLCLSFKEITLLIDGIDECKTAESNLVWQWLDKILKEVFVKLLITSEGWAKIPLPNEEFHRIRVDQNNKADIDAYIHEQISSRSGTGQIFGDEKLQADVRAHLQEKADGMFLWIHLVLQIILEDCDSPHEVKLAVKSLPSDLEAVYSRCLTRKRKNRRISDTKLLIWVCAAPKPLDVDALRELLAMDMETGQVSIDKMPAGELLLQSGGGLVALDVDEQLVLPVHSTARKFVFSELARGHFQSNSTSSPSDESWPLHIEAGRWSEANFRSALGSLCLFHIKQRTTRDLASVSEPTKMRVPQPEMPKFVRQLIPARFDTKAADVTIKSSPFRLNPKQASVSQFLQYAIENWLLCNKALASDDENFPWMRRETPNTGFQTSAELFESIARERNDSFGVQPWPSVHGSLNSHFSNMFAYAVANDHVPLLRVVKKNHRSLPKRLLHLPLALHGQMLAVHVAAKKGFDSILSELADICDLDAVCLSTGKRALHFAAEAGSGGCVEILLRDRSRGLDVRDKRGHTPLFAAALAGQEEIIGMLHGTGRVEVDAKDKDGLTPLWWASKHGHDKAVEALLETGKAEIEVQDESNRTPLSQAAEWGHGEVARLLIETGKARVDSKDKYGLTPLSHAAKEGRCRAAEVLLRTGKAEVETRDSYHWTPLIRAAVTGHDKVVEVLLVVGKAEVDARDRDGWTALFHAAKEGHGKAVEVLLGTGKAEVDAKDFRGLTPLWWAVAKGRGDVVGLLLGTGGVDLDVKDYTGMTLLGLAIEQGHYKVAQRLRGALDEREKILGLKAAL